jgi:hypothetical protein
LPVSRRVQRTITTASSTPSSSTSMVPIAVNSMNHEPAGDGGGNVSFTRRTKSVNM